jgi:hypothetical protein
MKKLILLLFTFTVLTAPSLVHAKDMLFDEEQISNATVLLYQHKGNSGSGTIIRGNNKYFILTASHVAKDMKTDAKIVFRLKGDKPGIYDLVTCVKGKSLSWKHHPIADMAIIELEPIDTSVKKLLADYAFPIDQVSGGKNIPGREADLTFLGYPIVDMEMEHFSPLMFTGYLSSGLITQLRADTKTKCNFFYLNVPSIQGCSGSGVYFSVKKKGIYYGGTTTYLIGVMHGTEGDNTGGKMAAVTPTYYINDLLEDPLKPNTP